MNNFRECTWARLRDSRTGLPIIVLSTHYGWGENFDVNAANLILAEAKRHCGDLPIFLLGDLNCNSSAPGYHTLISDPDVRLYDAMRVCSGACYPTNCTQAWDWTSFPYCDPSLGDQRIDFIFTGENVRVTYYESPRTVRASTNTTYSDHYPVVVEVVVPK
eukprot:TRINITY_DN2099_c0_g1_i1.p1 TRINITY_DN2099_c0_g1~~TRINITY_DN2099_c0_g1_i1.p1  ORF type:complete len:161 (-),score=33.80 TRINITY_DN2099_c0_g1_i1:70-552(-)